ncbi:MAG TPA: HDOD domain-containing protein [Dehalococcoidia bacterium]|nr:HDOD domain-containing protein [Dehalococcoidia bacterium]
MSLCLHEGVFRVRGFQDEVEEVRQHGIIAADVVSWVSGHARGPFYMAGLLHDVGKLVIYRMASVRHAKNRPTVETVGQMLKKYHPSVGVIVAEAWQLGEIVKIGAGFHHNPLAARSEHRRTAAMVQVADIAAHAVIPNRGAREHVGRKDLTEKFGKELNVHEALARARGAFGRFGSDQARGAA